MDPRSTAYHLTLVLLFPVGIHEPSLRAALAALVARHEMLRTSYEADPSGQPWLRPEPAFRIPLETAPAGEQWQQTMTRIAAEPFDLGAAPPVRTAIIREPGGAAVFGVVVHHIAVDGWSLRVLARDLVALYHAERTGGSTQLPAHELDYVDYVVWQRQSSDAALAAGLAFWTRELTGFQTLDLPLDSPRPDQPDFRGEQVHFRFPAEVAAAVYAFATRQRCGVGAVLTAAFEVVLARWTGQRDITIGTVLAGRGQRQIDEVVGFFVNTIALRVRLDPGATFHDLVRTVQGKLLDAHDEQDVPFERVVAAVAAQRDPRRNPIFDVAHVHHGELPTAVDHPANAEGVTRLRWVVPACPFELQLETMVMDGVLAGTVSYRSALFRAATVDALVAELVETTSRLLTAPGDPVLPAAITPPAALPAEWAGAAVAVAAGTLPKLFEQQVRRTPHALAIAYENTTLSYHELNGQANRMARRLVARGIGPEQLVALLLARSPGYVIAVLAVAKTGAAYLPVDPRYPVARIRYLLDDASPALVLTTRADGRAGVDRPCWFLDDDPAVTDLPVTDLPVTALPVTDLPVTDLPVTDLVDADRTAPLRPDHPAYVIYTSGSTGQPKGVVVTHTGIASLVATTADRLGLGPEARVLQFASSSFDAAFWDLAMALLTGATLVVAPDERLVPGPPLSRLVAEQRVTHAMLPPAAVLAMAPEDLAGLQTLTVGGEACVPELVKRWSTGRRLVNAYGPTECTVAATMTSALEPGYAVPIGRPVANTRVYVLDDQLRQVGVEVAGELYVAGAGLARAYLNRPGLTAQRFVANPFGPPGTRMYRTGDLARWRADGQLEFLGRTDDQIKLRGYRIELGEIEAVLAGQDGVGQVAALAREDVPGDRRLVAYLAPAPGRSVDLASVRAGIARLLPEFMRPAAYVVMERLPVTGSHKVDRKALPPPDQSAQAERPQPRTPREEILCAVFGELLGVAQVGLYDDFFQLGGHSLLVVRLLHRVRRAFGTELQIRDVFAAPTVAALARRLEDRSGHAGRAPLVSAPRPAELPLASVQGGLWLLHRMGGLADAYHMPFTFRIHGPLDEAALADAIGDVVARHEILRTLFVERDGRPRQEVTDRRPELVIQDLSEAELHGALLAAARQPFELAAEPPLRCRLFRLSATERVFLLLLHHIASDGWSLRPLYRDLAAAYAARRAGLPQDRPLPPVQYADYALWSWQILGDEDDPESRGRRQLDYWRSRLAGLPDELALPADRPRPAKPGSRAGRVTFVLDAELHARIRAVGLAHQASASMTLQAALALLYTRLGAGTDIPLGAVVSGRTDEALDDLVGFFVNTLVLRYDTAGDPTLAQMLARVREVNLTAYDHADVPFDQVVDAVRPHRDAARHPLFQTLLVLHDEDAGELELAGVTTRREQVPLGKAKFDLEFAFRAERGGGVHAVVDFNAEMFDEATVRRMGAWLQRLLDVLTRAPHLRLSEVELLDPAERKLILHEWVGGQAVPECFLLGDRLAEQSRRVPQAVAVTCGAVRLTYAQLQARVNGLARTLIARGIGPEDVVLLVLPRSADLIVAMFAVLTAGAAYLPTGPQHPPAWLRRTCADAGISLVLTTVDGQPRLPAEFAVPVLVLDEAETVREIAETSSVPVDRAELVRPLDPDNTAYVISTSGSTGIPKSVMVSHRSVAAFAGWAVAELGVERFRAVLAATSVTFDVSVVDTVVPLLCGGHIEVAGDLLGLTERAGAAYSLVCAVPSALSALVADLPRLRIGMLAVAGEEFGAHLLGEIRCALPGTAVANLYGPTEATVYATGWFAGDDTRPVVPIGRPLPTVRAYVLDDRLRPSPPGVPGELYLGGPQVARGYRNRPALTAERFVADPFGPPGARMYRTGDVVRWSAGGELEFLGRSDTQVKVRGFRIELGDVEAALSRHPAVRQTVAVVRKDATGERRLVAYLVTDARLDSAQLRRRAERELPAYAVPSAFVLLPELPLNPNGKLDRRALPEPVWSTAADFRAPRSALQRQIAAHFADLLGMQAAGADDDFFALGGHSLLAVRLISRIRGTCGVELSVTDVFERPTVAGLAALVERADATDADRPLSPRPWPTPLPLSAAQRRLWFLHRMPGYRTVYNLPFVIRLRGPLDVAAMRAALGDVVERHAPLRTRLPEIDGLPVQQVLTAVSVEVPVVAAESAALADLLARLARYEFDLARDLPLRATLIRLGPEDHVLCLVVHHIAADGSSTDVLWRDLGSAYADRCVGTAPSWPPLAVQYPDYTLWQQQRWDGDVPGRMAAFWRDTLAGLPPVLEMPTDRPRPAIPSLRGATESRRLDEHTHRALAIFAREHRATLFMVLHTAVAVLLSRLSGSTDIVVGTPVSGRDDPSLEELFGFFVNMVALRVDTAGDPSFGQMLERVRAADLAALSHQDMPFERVVDEVKPPRSLAFHPLFQVVVTFADAPVDPQFGGLATESLPVHYPVAKFDLTCDVVQHLGADGAPGGLDLRIGFATDLFGPVTRALVADRLVTVLAVMAADPQTRTNAVDLLPDAERRLLRDWGGTDRAPAGDTVPGRFGAQVRRVPEAVAVRSGGAMLTYRELDERADRLAGWLRHRGVGAESVVAVEMTRSLEQVVATLAVLKAGGAYLPLAADLAPRRRAAILAAAGATVVLRDDTAEVPVPVPAAVGPIDPEQIAYVMYTSGSTGEPKGVAVTHRDIVELATDPCFADQGPVRWLLHSPYSFDASTLELWIPLLTGGTVVVAPPGQLEPPVLRELVRAGLVSHVFLTAGLFDVLADEDPGCFRGLREVLTGGDVVPARAVRAVCHHSAGTRVRNLYGPTEVTVCATQYQVPGDVGAGVPIGRPMAGTRCQVLDDRLRPVPVGVPGELYVSGSGLARGYLSRPDLTAERFLADPAGPPGSRMYRTGDLARWRPDGTLDFIGRADAQIKIRGHRIEPAEIEAVLARTPQVSQVAVAVRDDHHGQLVAYVVPAEGSELNPDALLRAAAEELPEYMLPSAVVVLDVLPLTANQKVDRAALPVPPRRTAAGALARTPREAILCEIFADVLGQPRVGVHDDFFELGGHSLLVTRLASRIRSALALEVTVQDLFRAPTVARLADVLDGAGGADATGVLLPLRPGGASTPLFCVHPITGLSWCYTGLAHRVHPGVPIYALQARGLTGAPAPDGLAGMARDYVDQIRTVQPTGPYQLLGWSFGGLLAHAMAVRLQAAGAEVAALLLLDSYPAAGQEPAPPDDAISDLVRRHPGYETLAGSSVLPAVEAATRANLRLARCAPTGVFRGDVRLLAASETGVDPGTWQRYVTGEVRVHRIDADHFHLLGPAALPAVAQFVNDAVAGVEGSDRG